MTGCSALLFRLSENTVTYTEAGVHNFSEFLVLFYITGSSEAESRTHSNTI